jgi:hypothetical protein
MITVHQSAAAGEYMILGIRPNSHQQNVRIVPGSPVSRVLETQKPSEYSGNSEICKIIKQRWAPFRDIHVSGLRFLKVSEVSMPCKFERFGPRFPSSSVSGFLLVSPVDKPLDTKMFDS